MFGFENVFGKKAEKAKTAPAGEDLARCIESAAADLSPEELNLFRFVNSEASRFLASQQRG